MRKSLLLLAATVTAVFIACGNDTGLVSVPTPIATTPGVGSPSGTPVFSPTVGPTPFVTGTAMNCGNANYGFFDPNDPDDNPGSGDSMICIWSCTNLIDINHVNPPYEIREEWDFDAPVPAYLEFGPDFYPCYTYHP